MILSKIITTFYLNDLRKDIAADSYPTAKILQNAVNSEDAFVVPKVVE